MDFESEKRAKRILSDLVFAYRHICGEPERPLSYRVFAEELNQILSLSRRQVSHQTVKNWEDRHHLPHVSQIMFLALNGWGWQRDFAEDVLAGLRPGLCLPATEIGRRALERSMIDTGPQKKRFDSDYVYPEA